MPRIRGSPRNGGRMACVWSGDPSSTTISSQSVNDCVRRLSMARRKNLACLKVGMMTLTRGGTETIRSDIGALMQRLPSCCSVIKPFQQRVEELGGVPPSIGNVRGQAEMIGAAGEKAAAAIAVQ